MLSEHLNSFLCQLNVVARQIASTHNLSLSQYFTLSSISSTGISMTELSRSVGVDNSTLTRNIQKLEKNKLVKRFPDSYDRRVQIVKLTPKGASLLELLEGALEKISDNLIDQIDLDTQEHLITVLEKLSWALDLRRS